MRFLIFALYTAIGIFVLSASQDARAGLIYAEAGINLISGPDIHTSNSSVPFTEVTSEASGGGGRSIAYATTNLKLGSLSTSSGSNLINNASSTAQFNSNFTVINLPTGVTLPLTFNFSLDGTMAVSTTSEGVAVAQVSYEFQTTMIDSKGFAELLGQFGTTTSEVTGGFANGFIQQNGPSISYTYSSPLSITTSVNHNDVVIAHLSTFASSNSGGSVSVLYNDTLSLTSLTVPYNYTTVDPSQLEVVFASGLSMPVSRAAMVPEPSSFYLIISGLSAYLLVCLRRLIHFGRHLTTASQNIN